MFASNKKILGMQRKNMTHNAENNQCIKTGPELRQMSEITDKIFKIVIITVLQMLKYVSRNIEYTKTSQI